MRKGIKLMLLLAASGLLTSASSDAGLSHSSASSAEWLRFEITTVAEHAGGREVLAETILEGPAGTDFEIKLEGVHFRMDARFVNDLLGQDSLQVRADLHTRHLYGQSEKNLPLYEEDARKETSKLTFNEKLILLPFGEKLTSQESDQLKIEITPTKIPPAKTPLEIRIVKASPGNLINVSAIKIPHRFNYKASLWENGQEVATGKFDNALIEEQREVMLNPNSLASLEVLKNPLVANLAVARYLRNRPSDQVGIDFGLKRNDGLSSETIASHWSGIGYLGAPLSYDLSDYYLKSTGRKYELRLSISLAPGETAD